MKKAILIMLSLFLAAPLFLKAQDEEFEKNNKIISRHSKVIYTRSDGSVYESREGLKAWKEVTPPPLGQTNDFREIFCKNPIKKIVYTRSNGRTYSSYGKNVWKKEFEGPKINSQVPAYAFDVKLMPNPVKDIVKVQFSLIENEFVTASIFSLEGVEVMKIPANQYYRGINDIYIDMNSIQSGTYYLKIQAGGASAIKSLTLIK
jgi:hypothetical protein